MSGNQQSLREVTAPGQEIVWQRIPCKKATVIFMLRFLYGLNKQDIMSQIASFQGACIACIKASPFSFPAHQIQMFCHHLLVTHTDAHGAQLKDTHQVFYVA